MTEQTRDRSEDLDFECGPTNWDDTDEATFVLDSAEAAFAEARYLERPAPSPVAFAEFWTRAIPCLEEPAWPDWACFELVLRCVIAMNRIEERDETFEHYRNIYTDEAREAALERRATSRAAIGRWRDSGFTDSAAFDEMYGAIEATNAERRAS